MQEHLTDYFKQHRYTQHKIVHGLQINGMHPIQFLLGVNDFVVKYLSEEHA